MYPISLLMLCLTCRVARSRCDGQPLRRLHSVSSRQHLTCGASASFAGRWCHTGSVPTGTGATRTSSSPSRRDTGELAGSQELDFDTIKMNLFEQCYSHVSCIICVNTNKLKWFKKLLSKVHLSNLLCKRVHKKYTVLLLNHAKSNLKSYYNHNNNYYVCYTGKILTFLYLFFIPKHLICLLKGLSLHVSFLP